MKLTSAIDLFLEALEARRAPRNTRKAYRLDLAAFERCFPELELADATAFLRGTTGPAREAAAADFCQVLFCLNEFLYAE